MMMEKRISPFWFLQAPLPHQDNPNSYWNAKYGTMQPSNHPGHLSATPARTVHIIS